MCVDDAPCREEDRGSFRGQGVLPAADDRVPRCSSPTSSIHHKNHAKTQRGPILCPAILRRRRPYFYSSVCIAVWGRRRVPLVVVVVASISFVPCSRRCRVAAFTSPHVPRYLRVPSPSRGPDQHDDTCLARTNEQRPVDRVEPLTSALNPTSGGRAVDSSSSLCSPSFAFSAVSLLIARCLRHAPVTLCSAAQRPSPRTPRLRTARDSRTPWVQVTISLLLLCQTESPRSPVVAHGLCRNLKDEDGDGVPGMVLEEGESVATKNHTQHHRVREDHGEGTTRTGSYAEESSRSSWPTFLNQRLALLA
mmetsp:Transcript_27559/g.110396  ORF Transcript_27559/g.110396 Transcript_27559/m.110396 type:complete len:307 (-) Transcript_27559:1299-2219(-)